VHLKTRYVAFQYDLQEDVLFRGTAGYLLEGERSGFGNEGSGSGARGDAGPAFVDVLNYDVVKSKLSEMERGTVEETLNAMLDAEADQVIRARKYERTQERKDTRAGYYKQSLVSLLELRKQKGWSLGRSTQEAKYLLSYCLTFP
jgi:hypothetical protein